MNYKILGAPHTEYDDETGVEVDISSGLERETRAIFGRKSQIKNSSRDMSLIQKFKYNSLLNHCRAGIFTWPTTGVTKDNIDAVYTSGVSYRSLLEDSLRDWEGMYKKYTYYSLFGVKVKSREAALAPLYGLDTMFNDPDKYISAIVKWSHADILLNPPTEEGYSGSGPADARRGFCLAIGFLGEESILSEGAGWIGVWVNGYDWRLSKQVVAEMVAMYGPNCHEIYLVYDEKHTLVRTTIHGETSWKVKTEQGEYFEK
jgi:hypothetical protein